MLFIDEVHRFSKTQQDALLAARGEPDRAAGRRDHREPVVLGGVAAAVALAGAATALARPMTTSESCCAAPSTTIADSAGPSPSPTMPSTTWCVLPAATPAARSPRSRPPPGGAPTHWRVNLELVEASVDRAAVRYDRDGDQHYDVISAFIKSIRGSDVDAALHYLARMISAGEDPRFIARRLVCMRARTSGWRTRPRCRPRPLPPRPCN